MITSIKSFRNKRNGVFESVENEDQGGQNISEEQKEKNIQLKVFAACVNTGMKIASAFKKDDNVMDALKKEKEIVKKVADEFAANNDIQLDVKIPVSLKLIENLNNLAVEKIREYVVEQDENKKEELKENIDNLIQNQAEQVMQENEDEQAEKSAEEVNNMLDQDIPETVA